MAAISGIIRTGHVQLVDEQPSGSCNRELAFGPACRNEEMLRNQNNEEPEP